MCVGTSPATAAADASCNASGMPWLDSTLFHIFDKFCVAAIKSGYMMIQLPDGRKREYGRLDDVQTAVPGAPTWQGLPRKRCLITVNNTDFFYKVMTRHDTGLGEAYMREDISVDDVGALMAVITANTRNIEGNRGMLGAFNWLGDRLLYVAHLTRANTIEGSKRNISQHYDAGNDMYKLFLDESLTYSAGIHVEGGHLKDAQMRKLDSLIAGARVSRDSHVLEVGCGWGSCAIRAAQTTGCKWTGITVSMEQLVEARARVKSAGVEDRVSLMFCDYREVVDQFGQGSFDAVVSCEMIEAVGHEHLPTYFQIIGQALKPGGYFAMQVITMPDVRYDAYCATSDFIREHIFPGGHLPSVGAMSACAASSSLSAVELADIGPDYAISLRKWRENWKKNWNAIKLLGYPEEFMRKWEFYFAYCEAAFDSHYLQDYQIVWHCVPEAAQQPLLSHQPGSSACLRHVSNGRVVDTADSVVNAPQISSDTVTMALFAVYCILGGVAVARQPRMLLALITFVLGQASVKVSTQLLPVLIQEFESLSARTRAAWIVDTTCALWSLFLGLPALGLLLSSSSWISALQPRDSAPALLVYLAAGFWASHLAVLVQTMHFMEAPASLAHSALLLAIFGSAGFKEEHTGLLAMTLPALLCNVPATVCLPSTQACDTDLLGTVYRPLIPQSLSSINQQHDMPAENSATTATHEWSLQVSKAYSVRGLHAPHWLVLSETSMQVMLQSLLHAVVLLLVLVTPDIWSSPVYYMCATNGMIYANWVNFAALRASPYIRWLWKQCWPQLFEGSGGQNAS
eukprot:jgi/Ulvmu1/4360/UM002_0085.1